jgi:hypothetical protein
VLGLQENEVSAEGAEALLQALRWNTNMLTLNLSGNNILQVQ